MAVPRIFPALPWLFAAAITGALGCFPPDDGRSPPLDRFYFPVGLALGPDRTDGSGTGPNRLYVVNSDFDLQFNAGSVQVYDLDRVRALVPAYCDTDADCESGQACDGPNVDPTRIATHTCVDPQNPEPCGTLGQQDPAQRLLTPGLCNFVDPASPPTGGTLLIQSVSIGAFATDALYRVNPLGNGRQGRLLVPVRGDSTLHFIDVDDDGDGATSLDCGQGANQSCDTNHRRGNDAAAENTRDLTLPAEPFGIASDASGEAVVITHQTLGSVSLFVNRWSPSDGAPEGPNLEFIATGLPYGALGIASVPESAYVLQSPPGSIEYHPSFLLTFRNSAEVRLVQYFSDTSFSSDGSAVRSIDPSRPFLDVSPTVPIRTNSQGYDSRGLAVDDSARSACEVRCATAGDIACLKACATTSLDVYIANRSPSSMLLGVTQPNQSQVVSDDLPSFYDSIPLEDGPSRVYVGNVLGADGVPVQRIFVVCFDSRLIYVYDPALQRMEARISTGRGPQALAIDTANGLGYVAHFTDSYVGVVDLNKAHGDRYGRMFLTLGEPQAPRAAK